MRFKLMAGGEVDLLSPSEMESMLHKLGAKVEKLTPAVPDIIDSPVQLTVDANGNVGGGPGGNGVVIYKPPVGMYCTVNRLSIADTTHTPAAPLAAGWLAFYRAGIVSDGLVHFVPQSGSTAVLPVVISEGGGAKVLRNGQPLLVIGAGLPSGLAIGVSVQVTLWRESRPHSATVAEES